MLRQWLVPIDCIASKDHNFHPNYVHMFLTEKLKFSATGWIFQTYT